jgi:hypothetical protein
MCTGKLVSIVYITRMQQEISCLVVKSSLAMQSTQHFTQLSTTDREYEDKDFIVATFVVAPSTSDAGRAQASSFDAAAEAVRILPIGLKPLPARRARLVLRLVARRWIGLGGCRAGLGILGQQDP